MPEYTVNNHPLVLRPHEVVGKGGEADVYKNGLDAYKIFKTSTHPDLVGFPNLQNEAKMRIAEQQKKLPAFPKNLPSRVIVPEDFVYDRKGLIVGYKMKFIPNSEALLRYGEKNFRTQGVSDDDVREIFVDLHQTVDKLHGLKVVIGDFNDLNVLVSGQEAYIIDADSMQFGNFPSRMFTLKFVDPLICDIVGNLPMMARYHSSNTDWYAYLIMLMQSLLFVGPYGGVYRPKDKKKNVPHDLRAQKRISVFDSEVIYPRPARLYKILPDDLLNYFVEVFTKDKRGVPPIGLVENLRFSTCDNCGTVHARSACPSCFNITKTMQKEIHLGTVKGVKIFETPGKILFASVQNGELKYLYHENGVYKREKDRQIVVAPLDPFIRFRISNDETVFARNNECLVFTKSGEKTKIAVDSYGQLPIIDANDASIFYSSGGALYKSSQYGYDFREKIGDVLQNQTLFWVGDKLAFGFYRAADLSNFFIFRPQFRGINDSVSIESIRGQLIDSTALIGRDRIWFFTTTQEGQKTINKCFAIDSDGKLLGTGTGSQGDGTWLGNIRGGVAVNDFILMPTDDGVVRVESKNSVVEVSKEYPDTKRFVDSDSKLFINSNGLLVVSQSEIWQLTIS